MRRTIVLAALASVLALFVSGSSASAQESVDYSGGQGRPITLVVRDAPIAEVFEMLSRNEQVNILLGKGVTGEVSVSLYEEKLDHTVRAVAEAAGFLAERRGRGYVILDRNDAGKDSVNGNSIIRTMRVHHSDTQAVSEILENHLSRYGEITVLADRRMIVLEDLPDFVTRVEGLLADLDREPRQILLEAKILEISLDNTESYGIDWVRTFEAFDGMADVGVIGLANLVPPTFFFDLVNDDMALLLTALAEQGRVRALATPTLLALEDEEAEVVIGDRLGFRVVTTVNQVTSESVEFLESGVILRLTASVNRDGRIMLEVHPEVSTGVIDDGLPSQSTTEVTTKLIANDGQPIFIGGLIRDRFTENEQGVPFLKDIPILGWLFRKHHRFGLRTETVVLLTAHALEEGRQRAARDKVRWLPDVERSLAERRDELEEAFEHPEADPEAPDPDPLPASNAPEDEESPAAP